MAGRNIRGFIYPDQYFLIIVCDVSPSLAANDSTGFGFDPPQLAAGLFIFCQFLPG